MQPANLCLQIRLTRKSELQLGIAPKSGAWHPKVPKTSTTTVKQNAWGWFGLNGLVILCWIGKILVSQHGSTPPKTSNICNNLYVSLGSMLEFRSITDFFEPPKRRTPWKCASIFDISKTRPGWTVEQSAGSYRRAQSFRNGRNDGDIFQPYITIYRLWRSLIFKHLTL